MSGTAPYVTPAELAALGGPLRRRMIWWERRAGQRLADMGLPPALLRHAHVPHVPAAERADELETVHPARTHRAPLPLSVPRREALSDDAGWWGFSRRDVPERRVDPVQLLHFDDVRVLAGRTADAARSFSPAILDARGRSVDLREIRYRPFHAALARRAPDLSLERAVWIAERVFDNHSHWLSAHLPKLVLLRERGLLDDLVLPEARPVLVDASLRALGIDPAGCATLATDRVLAARRLTVVACDRFHPELMDAARAALVPPDPPATGRLLVSRRTARGRRLLEEAAMMPMLRDLGFSPVAMEEHGFAEQVRLVAGADALLAPHGAGLTNMLFCRSGTPVVEIADPDYPNPNFYAMAAALGLPYALVDARGVGAAHPLERDLSVDPIRLRGPRRARRTRAAERREASSQGAFADREDRVVRRDVSVVVPCRNGAEHIGATLRAVLVQTAPPAEVIVVDDGSSDATRTIAASFGPPVVVLSGPARGAAHARNAGAAAARGARLMFLDADDLLTPGTLAALGAALDDAPREAFALCPWDRLERGGNAGAPMAPWLIRPASNALPRPGQDPLAAWLTGTWSPPCCVLWTREGFAAAGRWWQGAGLDDDGNLMRRAMARGVTRVPAPDGLALHRRAPGEALSYSGRRLEPWGLAVRLASLADTVDALEEGGSHRATTARRCTKPSRRSRAMPRTAWGRGRGWTSTKTSRRG